MLIQESAIVMEQNPPGDLGNYGDSCAESARYLHLKMWLNDYKLDIDLSQFVTSTGYIRSPKVAHLWGEKDFSGDQALPLYLAFSKYDPIRTSEMEARFRTSGYRTGNGDLVSVGMFGALKQSKIIINISTVVQGLIFKFPYRWSESKKGFEKTVDSSADYLNWLHLALHGSKLARKSVSKETLKKKVREYYDIEPNNTMIISLYDQVIERYF